MKTKEVKLYVQAVKWQSSTKWEIEIASVPFSSCDFRTVVQLSEVTVEVQIPDIDEKQLTLEEVKQLEQAITQEKNESYVRVKAIEEKIQSLLALDHIN
jgi:hypothetical protein